jgi:hypothetical protein
MVADGGGGPKIGSRETTIRVTGRLLRAAGGVESEEDRRDPRAGCWIENWNKSVFGPALSIEADYWPRSAMAQVAR